MVGPELSRLVLGNVLLKKTKKNKKTNKRLSADGQNIAQEGCGDNAVLD